MDMNISEMIKLQRLKNIKDYNYSARDQLIYMLLKKEEQKRKGNKNGLGI